MRCAIYARYSTDKQRETSSADQIAAARRYAAAQQWTILEDHIYVDEAKSGASTEQRGGLEALRRVAGSPRCPFDTLLLDDSSRLARDYLHAGQVLRELKFAGVRVVCVSQGLDTNQEIAELLFGILGAVDGHALRDVAQKIKRGLRGQLSRGYATGSRTYGYRSEPEWDPSGRLGPDGKPIRLGARLVIQPAEADVVRRIFERYASGSGVPMIVVELNDSDVPGPQGRPWRHGMVQRVLRNDKYRGVHVWGKKRFVRQPRTRRRVARPSPEREWERRDAPELRIVNDDLWWRVQQRLAASAVAVVRQPNSGLMRGRNAALHSRHLLSGLSRCGVCGKAITVVSGGYGTPRYGCQHSWRNGTGACDNRLTIRATVADAALLAGVQEHLARPETVSSIAGAVSAEVARHFDASRRETKDLERERRTVTAEVNRLVRAIAAGGDLPAVIQALRERQDRLSRLESELDGLHDAPTPPLAVIPTWVRQKVSDLTRLLKKAPERTKTHLRDHQVQVTFTPVRDEGRPFLRATCTGNLLPATCDLPAPRSATDASHPRSGL
ncbi:MAG: recombinase family protein [Acidobacteriota bacterium]